MSGSTVHDRPPPPTEDLHRSLTPVTPVTDRTSTDPGPVSRPDPRGPLDGQCLRVGKGRKSPRSDPGRRGRSVYVHRDATGREEGAEGRGPVVRVSSPREPRREGRWTETHSPPRTRPDPRQDGGGGSPQRATSERAGHTGVVGRGPRSP